MQHIAFIGLGAMGEPMAANLLKAGFPVTVVGHRRPEPLERLKAAGAMVAAGPAEAAKRCDVAILMLPGSAEVEAVLTGSGGMAEALPGGCVVIDCSTSHPASTRRLAALLAGHGVGFVDAGVTRGVAGAKSGKLAYFVGGSDADFEKARPALDAMGDTCFRMGKVGSGHETKSLSNALSYATVALVNETLMLGAGLGIDPGALREALMAGAGSKALEAFGPRIVAREYTPPRVSVGNVRAHLAMAQEMAPAGMDPVMLSLAKSLYDKVGERGFEGADMAALAELWPKS